VELNGFFKLESGVGSRHSLAAALVKVLVASFMAIPPAISADDRSSCVSLLSG
jgi:hypothetical protein